MAKNSSKKHGKKTEELRAHLAAFGWTQAKAGQLLGVHYITVAQWSSGRREPSEPALRFLRVLRMLREANQELFSNLVGG